MRRDFERLVVLGGGPTALRIIHAARELAVEGALRLRTVALHDPAERGARYVREADEALAVPAWPPDLPAMREALGRVRAEALWDARTCAGGAGRTEPGQPGPRPVFDGLCGSLGIAYLGASAAPPIGRAELERLAVGTGWSTAPAEPGARRIEVTALRDRRGRAWVLGVADVTPRAAGPLLVECPAPSLDENDHLAVSGAAQQLVHALDVVGTVIVDAWFAPDHHRFGLVAVHRRSADPCVEAATGLDLMKTELDLARGGLLDAVPRERDHAAAVELTSEDPERGFAPTAGTVAVYRTPDGTGARLAWVVARGDVVRVDEPMLATVVAAGRTRREALARLACALRETSVVVRGGASNKAALIARVRAEMSADPAATEVGAAASTVALCATAIAAYDVLRARDTADFFRTAKHGRPRIAATGGRRVVVLHEHATFPFAVAQVAADRYRLETDHHRCEIGVEVIDASERRLALAGHSYHVRTVADGGRYVVEVDGVPFHLSVADTLEVVRSPSPAVVLRIPARPGAAVAAGDPLVVLESMKMEITVAAPTAGRVRELLVTPSSQVDLEAPLLVYETAQDPGAVAPGRVRWPVEPDAAAREPRTRFAGARDALHRLLLGFDADAGTARPIASAWKAVCADLPATDPELERAEAEALAIFADVQSVLRRQPREDVDDDDGFASAQEHLVTFLRALGSRDHGLPASFVAALARAVARYGVTSLDDSPALRAALPRLFCSHERADDQALVIAAILDRRLARPAGGELAGDEFRRVLDHVIGAARRRFPVVHELAVALRHARYVEPMFERTRDAIYRRALAEIDALEATASPAARVVHVKALVDCPQPLIALLAPRFAVATPAVRAAMLEVITARNYRTRALQDLVVHETAGAHCATASYAGDDHRVTVLTTYAPRDQLGEAVRRLAPLIARAGEARHVVVDIYTWSTVPLAAPSDDAAALRDALAAAALPPGLCRVVVATAGPGGGPGPIRCVTYRGGANGYDEDLLSRGVHPMIGRRMQFWRLSGFDLERLPSVEDVYLYRGVAKDNPRDERLFAMAEVRDLTPVRDAGGRIVQLPYLERVLGEALAALRGVQAARPLRDRLQWNRVILFCWEPLTLAPAELDDVVRRLAPVTEGLGIEQVLVYARVAASGGGLREAVLRISNTLDGHLHVRYTDPPHAPLATLTAYEQKVIALRRRGLTYPYEIVRLLAPARPADGFPAGDFVEHDLDDRGALVPVARPPGASPANIVVGVVRNFTAQVPEGVTRVILLGDASKEMGSLAEPECRRVIAALDLAERLRVPLEWFALSAGAKIAKDSGTENMDWIAAVLRRIVEFTQRGGELNIVVCGINVGGQPYWNAEATMLMHTRGILVMVGDSAMVLTGKQALDFSGSTSAEDNQGIGGYERIMGPNGQAQYWAPDLGEACRLLLRHYAHAYVVPGERFPRRAISSDPPDRDVRPAPHPGDDLATIGDVFGPRNAERKRPFDIRAVMRAVTDRDHEPLERWRDLRDGGEIAVVWDAHLGGVPVCMLGIESHALPRRGFIPGDGPVQWTSGTLFPRGSKKLARAVNSASGIRPLVVIANLAGFDGSPESMREAQLEYGAEIGRAIVNFDGPIVFSVVSRYHGGAFVVFSKMLNDQMEVIAVEGARASVIGGAPAAAVVFARDVDARTASDPRLVALEREIARAAPAGKSGLREELAALRPVVRSEKLGEVADEFDHIHSVQRALAVGSLDRIVPIAALRPTLIDALDRLMARTLARWRAAR